MLYINTQHFLSVHIKIELKVLGLAPIKYLYEFSKITYSLLSVGTYFFISTLLASKSI